MINNEPVLIYLGPTIRGVVKHGASFCSGFPRQLEEFSAENKVIKNLIVPVSKIQETTKAISAEGTVENIAFRKLKNA